MKKHFSEFGETPTVDNAERKFLKEDLIYLAGFVDGEGCMAVGIKRSKKKYISYQVRLTVTNTNKEVLIWCKNSFGGNVYKRKKQEFWYKEKYEWVVGGGQLDILLPQIIPFLRIKKEEAKLALEMRKTFPVSYGNLNNINKKRKFIFDSIRGLRDQKLRVTTERKALREEMKPQSELYGNIQRSAEMTDPLERG